MTVAFSATKLVVAGLAAAEAVYTKLGLRLVARNLGGEGEYRQDQSWLSTTGDANSHMLILSRFVELPTPPAPTFPGELWLALNVPDVQATIAAVKAAGGQVLRKSEDRPEHGVCAAVVSDPEGHIIEVVGPLSQG